MSFIDRLQQKPEPQRRRIFWLSVLVASLVVTGLWAISFRATLKHISIKGVKETPAPAEENTEEATTRSGGVSEGASATEEAPLNAGLGQGLETLKRIVPFLGKIMPQREEVIK